jgi:hypothetical protein
MVAVCVAHKVLCVLHARVREGSPDVAYATVCTWDILSTITAASPHDLNGTDQAGCATKSTHGCVRGLAGDVRTRRERVAMSAVAAPTCCPGSLCDLCVREAEASMSLLPAQTT